MVGRNWVEDRADREYAGRETKLKRSTAGVRAALAVSITCTRHSRRSLRPLRRVLLARPARLT